MAVLEIISYPDARLNKACEVVEEIDDETGQLIDDLVDTLYSTDKGVGLAAPQVGSDKRVVVCDVGQRVTGEKELVVLVNPEIVEADGQILSSEGCLSCPELEVEVPRYEYVRVRALDREGKSIDIESDDFLAIVIQHELDHLEGTTIAHRLSSLKRKFYRRKLRKLQEQA